jgi:hypothetical protein
MPDHLSDLQLTLRGRLAQGFPAFVAMAHGLCFELRVGRSWRPALQARRETGGSTGTKKD